MMRKVYINEKGNRETYTEMNEYWFKYEYGSNNKEIYYVNSDGYWAKWDYDSNNNKIYYENSNGYWNRTEYDSDNNRIYEENSDGYLYKQPDYDTIFEDDTTILTKDNIDELLKNW